MRIKSDKCSKCKINLRAVGGRYCLDCKSEYMRTWRLTHPMSPEARIRHNARCYVKMYVNRGKIAKLPCMVCGEEKVLPYHKDHSKPLEFQWLCKTHKPLPNISGTIEINL